jgi:hypothetical protein
MTRRFVNFLLPLAFLLEPQSLSRAEATAALVKSAVLENDALYLRVAEVGKDLPEEIQSAQSALAATNKIAGTILDLRLADGDDPDSVKATASLFAEKKLPLAILVDNQTRGAALQLAEDLREAHDGLIFGDSTEIKPDIAMTVKAADEKMFLENPFGTPAQEETNAAASTNTSLYLASFVDHTTEADLVREKIKDGDQEEDSAPPRPAGPPKPFIRDPVLARALDLIKGLAIVRQSRSDKL